MHIVVLNVSGDSRVNTTLGDQLYQVSKAIETIDLRRTDLGARTHRRTGRVTTADVASFFGVDKPDKKKKSKSKKKKIKKEQGMNWGAISVCKK